MAEDKYCSVRFKTGAELDEALAAALQSCDDAARAEEARQAIENMTVSAVAVANGEPPTVEKTEENGVVTLTFGLPLGADGKDGYTPVKGTDYWTAADQQVIISEILAVMPSSLPAVTTEDNGKLLQVVDGTWAAVALLMAEEASF